MANLLIDVTDLGGEALPGDKVVLWKPEIRGSAKDIGRVVSTAPVTATLHDGKATVTDVEPGDMRVLLQCRGVELQGPIDVVVPDMDATITFRSLLESQYDYEPPIVSAVQNAVDKISTAERDVLGAHDRVEKWASEVGDNSAQAVRSAADAKTSETNAKAYANNALSAADRAEFAAEETIQQVEGDFATRNYVDALGWKQGKIPLNANLDTWLNDGDFEIDTYAVATSLTGRPNSITGTIGAAHFRQFTSQAGHKTQLWEAYGNAISPAVRVSRAKFGDYWQPWTKIADSTDLAKVHIRRGAISSGANLNEWSQDGSFDISTYAIASSLVGRPSGDALGAADFQQTTTDAGHKVQRWVRIQGDTGTPIELIRTKGISAGAFTDWLPTTPTAGSAAWKRTDTIHMWGDSAVADKLAAELNSAVTNTVANRGGWGWTSNDVLLRAGVIQLSGVPVGGSIPASGDVQIDLLGQRFTTRPARTISASWAGIPGELIHQQDETWIFRRTTTGTAVPITMVTPVISNDAGIVNSGTHIFLFAGNDILEDAGHAPETNLEDHIVANYARAIEAIRPDPTRHVLIGGVKSKAADEINSPAHQLTVAVNNRLRSMFPAHFIDREAWLATRGMAAAGLTPSADDEAKMAAGMAPAGVMYDHTHVKPEVVAAEASELWATALKVRGWA